MQIFLALIIVLSLIILTAILLRYALKIRIPFINPEKRQLRLAETLYLDNKRRLVVVYYQDKKYLLLLGQNDLMLDSNSDFVTPLLDDKIHKI